MHGSTLLAAILTLSCCRPTLVYSATAAVSQLFVLTCYDVVSDPTLSTLSDSQVRYCQSCVLTVTLGP
jgi:hypothetical protein